MVVWLQTDFGFHLSKFEDMRVKQIPTGSRVSQFVAGIYPLVSEDQKSAKFVLIKKKCSVTGKVLTKFPGSRTKPAETLDQALIRYSQLSVGLTPIDYELVHEHATRTTDESFDYASKHFYWITKFDGELLESSNAERVISIDLVNAEKLLDLVSSHKPSAFKVCERLARLGQAMVYDLQSALTGLARQYS